MKHTAKEKIHIHVVNDAGAPPALLVNEQRFWSVFPQAQRLKAHITLTIGSGEEGLAEALTTVDILLANNIPQRVGVGRAPRLKWIHVMSAGIDFLLPLDWLPDHVVLTNSSGVHVPKAGEFICCSLLMLNCLIPAHVSNQGEHRWVAVHSGYIAGKTAVIVGVGAIGGEAARKARELGLRVLGVRRTGRRHRYVDRMYRPHQLREVLPQADFVVIAAPLTSRTIGLFGRIELDLLKRTAGVVNIGRAAIVDYAILAEKLNKGEVGGAILDVFAPEPLPEQSPLWKCRNLILTPHVSLDAPDYTVRVLRVFAVNLRRFLTGKPLRNRVRPDLEY
jgi:glyoxylate/hydroxypyruvate reductase